jgi:hypothetical protein
MVEVRKNLPLIPETLDDGLMIVRSRDQLYRNQPPKLLIGACCQIDSSHSAAPISYHLVCAQVTAAAIRVWSVIAIVAVERRRVSMKLPARSDHRSALIWARKAPAQAPFRKSLRSVGGSSAAEVKQLLDQPPAFRIRVAMVLDLV